MDTVLTPKEEQNKKKARLVTIVYATIILMLLIYPFITYLNPPPGQEGIVVNLGQINTGQSDDNAPKQESAPVAVAEPEPADESAPPQPTPPKEQPAEPKEVIKTEDPDVIALREKREKERREKIEQEQKEKAAKQKAEAERKRKAEAARKKEAAERAAAEKEAADLKKNLLEGLGGGKPSKSNNQGVENDNPDAKALEGISAGAGKVGGGLGGRGITSAPTVKSACGNKRGRVVVRVCVNTNGKVINAEFKQAGSNTSDKCLRDTAIGNAKKWGFSKGIAEKQCGTITYDFKIK